ncbi:invasion associated locus B family protein [Roseinatronobacter alkalisoli]|uniref:Invasion associated locus B family protein n=1 Tax=Roseinatronobacter alkalisoli TaxID=3028235 RepID=A0ABT5TDQ7_9RHOB|nr:invasion associated locus B family protein [Roseinatronobacter sp. HJB301]MDD7973256.1 invasion associated locus B family protein [Roseinatronobacter sp. HJB301]
MQCTEVSGTIICTMLQDVRAQGQAERLISARVDLLADDTPRLTLILPLGLDLDAGLELYPGTSQEMIATVSPSVCQQSECYAFLSLIPDFLQVVRERIALRIRMTPFNAQATEVPLSLRGFFDALERLNNLKE